MCWSSFFGIPNSKKPKGSSSSSEKKRRDSPAHGALHGHGQPVVADVSEKRRSKDSTRKRRSKETPTLRAPGRGMEEPRPRSQRGVEDAHLKREHRRPTLNVQVPDLHHRPIIPGSACSSQEALLNPRPHRSQHTRQRHPKRPSQGTLKGRGAKRDPPRHSKSNKALQQDSPRGWSLFAPAPSPPKTPKRPHRHYEELDPSPRSHRSSHHHRSPPTSSQVSPESSRSQHRHRPSRHQHDRLAPSTRRTRSSTPNTTARRVPDRRFAVLAATNQALENVRREAFAQPSPPPRRERLRRYEGVTLPTSQIPFNWDCVSSSQTSAGHGHGESSSSRQRRSRR
ncbi:hypothetical protein ACN47E_009411 [Coniothyrium glycines]